jgi:pyrroloquinoline quinone (PQQ) biosynthesis protein C
MSAKFFQQLVDQTDEARKSFERHARVVEACAQGMDRETYLRFLRELYSLVWHFNPVSAAAAARLPAHLRYLQAFLYAHMAEEEGHDEWVLGDVAALGGDVADVRLSLDASSPAAQCFVAFNYWMAERKPAGVLGMLFVLEVLASVYGEPVAEAQRERLFLDGDAGVSFLASHSSADAAHMEDLRVVLDQLEDGAAQAAIVNSVKVNYQNLARVVEGVYADAA